MGISEDKFIQQINAKEVGAFRALFEHFYNYLVLYAMKRVRQREVAEDVVQEVFVAIWESPKEYNSFHGFKAFLYDAVQNRCLDYLKHQMVVEEYERKVRIGELRLLWLEEHSDENDVIKSVISHDLQDVINESVEKLSPKCAKIFRLCYFEDMSHKDIAETMGISSRTVEWHIRQAIIFLRKDLHHLFILILCFSTYK